jgi:hypothetical protein
MFEKDPHFHRVKDSYEDLVIEIVNASEGVFLWARLEKEASHDAQGTG